MELKLNGYRTCLLFIIAVSVLTLFLISCGEDLFNSVDDDVENAGPADTFTVSYEDNGATGGEAPVDLTEYETGETVTVLGTGTLEKDEYEFFHWNTKYDDSGYSYEPGPTLVMGDSDVVLWAVWTQLPSYTVTFDSQGGELSSGSDCI